MEALQILVDEKLCENSTKLGELFRTTLRDQIGSLSWVLTVRGKGLLNAVIVDPEFKVSAWQLCLNMRDAGLVAKQTHDNIIRFAPPLVITEPQMKVALGKIVDVFHAADK